ncbi:hypothetical protein BGX38DRAFT_1215725 [Terfezia claveryi]|nr:hypothetical protein BGX38DRAFT_1215725 [Terfezia claveryi]
MQRYFDAKNFFLAVMSRSLRSHHLPYKSLRQFQCGPRSLAFRDVNIKASTSSKLATLTYQGLFDANGLVVVMYSYWYCAASANPEALKDTKQDPLLSNFIGMYAELRLVLGRILTHNNIDGPQYKLCDGTSPTFMQAGDARSGNYISLC